MQGASLNLFLEFISLFSFTSKLLWNKYQNISYLISLIHLIVISKLRLQTIKIKSISSEKFEQIILSRNINLDSIGDLNSCALVSINTLIALSVKNKSWLRITNKTSDTETDSENDEGFNWRITMPPVGKNGGCTTKDISYLIRCLGIFSNELKDFVIYVTDVKLFNISKHLSKNNDNYCDLIDEIKIDNNEVNYHPQIAKSAEVSPIMTGNDISVKDFEDILTEFFKKPKFLKVNEVFQVNLFKYGKHLKSRTALYNVENVYFKVISLTGESERDAYYVVKGCTNLYLKSTVHGYIPQKVTRFIKPIESLPGFEISICPDGLVSYHEKLKRICEPFLKNNQIVSKRMFLLCGPEGSGKKTLLKSVASFFGLHLLHANCFDFYGLNPSLTEGKFDQVFAKARRTVPCVIHFQNVELLGREQNYKENARLIDIFETLIKELWVRKPASFPLLVFGSTRLKPSEIVPAVARLFIQTITFEPPKFEITCQMLKWFVSNSNMICSSADLIHTAERTRGYVFADLELLVNHAIRFQSLLGGDNRVLLREHFDKAIETMEAAYSDSIGAARVPTVHWEDVGGLAELKEEIMLTLNLPLKHPELFASGLKRSGIVFYGPPGTGKTLMAKAIATECNYNFLSVKGPELMNMYVGQSEKNVRDVFERAREASPCIIFFDELDSLAPNRGKSGDSGGVTDRVVSQLLAEMDGLDRNKDVFVIAATNRPDLIDPALLRPGRFDKMFYVGVCEDEKSKLSVLKALTRRFTLSPDVNFEKILKTLPNLVTGADLYSICSNAWFSAARRAINSIEKGSEVSLPLEVLFEDFQEAFEQFVPSLTSDDLKYYENLKGTSDTSK